jgi:hypothetical protein
MIGLSCAHATVHGSIQKFGSEILQVLLRGNYDKGVLWDFFRYSYSNVRRTFFEGVSEKLEAST